MKIKMNDILKIEKPDSWEKKFKISWKMTDWCNYSCSYCYMASAVSKGKNTPFETILQIASKIDKLIDIQAKNKEKVELHMIGGEVCWYDLIKVLEQIKSPKLKTVIIATNFSQSYEYWKQLKKYCKSRNIYCNIISSFHLTKCNPDEFVSKAIKLHTKVKCVVNDDNLELYRPYFERLLESNISIQCTVERDNINSCENSITNPKSQEYVDFLNKDLSKKVHPYYTVTLSNGETITYYSNIEMINSIDIGGLDTEGFYCTAGIDGIRITQNGTLQRAGCRFCASKFGAGKLGNILDDATFDKLPLTDPILCHSSLPEEQLDENGNKNGLPDWNRMTKKYCTCFINANMYRKI